MSIRGYRMFAGELDGVLAPSYIGYRAGSVRCEIARNCVSTWREAYMQG